MTPEAHRNGCAPGVVLLLRHEGQRRPQREHRDRQAPACSLSTDAFSGKASRSSRNGEARESGRCSPFPSSRRQWKAISRPCPAWNRERARHRTGDCHSDGRDVPRYCLPTPVVQRVVATLHLLEPRTTQQCHKKPPSLEGVRSVTPAISLSNQLNRKLCRTYPVCGSIGSSFTEGLIGRFGSHRDPGGGGSYQLS